MLVSSLTSVEICSEMRPALSTTGVKERPTPNCLNSIETLPWWSRPDGNGKFAAGEETRRFARYGGQVRLGQDVDETDLVERLQRRPEDCWGSHSGIAVVLGRNSIDDGGRDVCGGSVGGQTLTELRARGIAQRVTEQAELIAGRAMIGTPAGNGRFVRG